MSAAVVASGWHAGRQPRCAWRQVVVLTTQCKRIRTGKKSAQDFGSRAVYRPTTPPPPQLRRAMIIYFTMRLSFVASVLLLAITALVGGAARDVWGDSAKRQAYQHRLLQRAPPAPLVNANTLEADVARTRERVKCRDSDVILVSYPKVSWNHHRQHLDHSTFAQLR